MKVLLRRPDTVAVGVPITEIVKALMTECYDKNLSVDPEKYVVLKLAEMERKGSVVIGGVTHYNISKPYPGAGEESAPGTSNARSV